MERRRRTTTNSVKDPCIDWEALNLQTSDEADWIHQLFCSYEVIRVERNKTDRYDPSTFAPVLITESTCEMQNGPDKQNTAKFTWRYADNRPVLHLTASPGIFTSPYNIVFS